MKASLKQELIKAKKGKYAVPAFNFDNIEMMKAIIESAEEENSPVILMLTESAAKYIGKEIATSSALALIEKVKVPVILHWDHGFDLDLIKWACDNGYSSVMLDASLEKNTVNIEKTKEIVEYAKTKGVEVESEIGHVGGKEDDRISNVDHSTNVEEAVLFDKETQIDALAISVGTAHGIFKSEPNLNFERIREINSLVETPLVLHGSSGVKNEDLKKAIDCGITKINIGTDIKVANAEALRIWFKENPTGYDARKFGRFAIDSMKITIKNKMKVLNSSGKA